LSACASDDYYVHPDGTLRRVKADDPPPAPIVYAGSSAGEPLAVVVESEALPANPEADPDGEGRPEPVFKRLILRPRIGSPADRATSEENAPGTLATAEPPPKDTSPPADPEAQAGAKAARDVAETKTEVKARAEKVAEAKSTAESSIEAAAAVENDAGSMAKGEAKPSPPTVIDHVSKSPPETDAPPAAVKDDPRASWLANVLSLGIPDTDECWWSSAGAVVKSLSPDTLYFCGVIDARTVDAARAAIAASERSPKRFVIASAGGKKVWPIELARLLMEKGLEEIVVAGPCFSGCAHFVFPALPKRYVLPEGMLGLHNTASSIFEMIAKRNRKSLSLPENQSIRQRALIELDLVRGLGIKDPRRFLTDAQAMLDTSCMDSVGIDRTGEEIYAYQSSYTIWVPDAQQWNDWGVPYEKIDVVQGDRNKSELSDLQFTDAALNVALVRQFWKSAIPSCAPVNDR